MHPRSFFYGSAAVAATAAAVLLVAVTRSHAAARATETRMATAVDALRTTAQEMNHPDAAPHEAAAWTTNVGALAAAPRQGAWPLPSTGTRELYIYVLAPTAAEKHKSLVVQGNGALEVTTLPPTDYSTYARTLQEHALWEWVPTGAPATDREAFGRLRHVATRRWLSVAAGAPGVPFAARFRRQAAAAPEGVATTTPHAPANQILRLVREPNGYVSMECTAQRVQRREDWFHPLYGTLEKTGLSITFKKNHAARAMLLLKLD